MTDHIIPPRELMEQWASEKCYDERDWLYEFHIATRAAQWGADQELEACCEWVRVNGHHWTLENRLRAARRPKPPSLKEQALAELDQIPTHDNEGRTVGVDVSIIRHALEQLDD